MAAMTFHGLCGPAWIVERYDMFRSRRAELGQGCDVEDMIRMNASPIAPLLY